MCERRERRVVGGDEGEHHAFIGWLKKIALALVPDTQQFLEIGTSIYKPIPPKICLPHIIEIYFP
jgi:hypothetical protein